MSQLNPLAPAFVPASLQEDSRSSSSIISEPYVASPQVAATLAKEADLDSLLQEDTSLLSMVTFGRDFPVRDEHIVRLVDAAGAQLTSLRLGNSDTGNGSYITDAAVLRIVDKCPKLEVLQLASCTGVTTPAFLAIADRLGELRELHCTGHDRSCGSLKAAALDPLLKDNALPKLSRLYLTDQSGLDFPLIQRLIRKRPGLHVLAGETDSDSAAWGCVLQQMGRSYGDGLYGNMPGMADPCVGLGDPADDIYGTYGCTDDEEYGEDDVDDYYY